MTLVDESQITWDQLLEEREWRKCFPTSHDTTVLLEGFSYFCANYVYIKHPDRGRIKFEMFQAQQDSAQLWLESRYSIMLKARQIGFSTLVSIFCFWLTFGYEDRVVIMLSRTERDAIKLLAKAKYSFRFLPEWMKERGPVMNATQTKIEFSNESYMESLPSASDPARGESVYLAVIDELAYLPNSEEAWASIEPVADVGGRVITLSTANGEGNLFHQLWVGARNQTNRFKAMFHPWWASGRSQAWYDDKVRDLPEWQIAQEYPSDEDEAFLKSGRPVFNIEMLRKQVMTEPIAEGFFNEHRTLSFQPDRGGPCRIWEMPREDGRYCIGADPSQGLEHGDFSSAHVINARDGEVVALWHGHIDPDLFGTHVLAPLGRMYNQALVGVESNNHGLSTLKAMHKERYHPLYMQRSPRYKKSVPTDILGWRTTQITKPLAIDELNKGLREGALHLHDQATLSELRGFVRDDSGKLKGSPFDDRVISLAIACQMLKHVWLPQFEAHKTPGLGTMGYFEAVLYGDDPLSKIGQGSTLTKREPYGAPWIRKTG